MTAFVSRRTLILGGGATILLAGCTDEAGNLSTPSRVPSSTTEARPATVGELIAAPRFTVAHRGSGDNWPEHTLVAYENALRAGAAAVEISVRRTADGVLVCHHDATTDRTSQKRGTISKLSYAQLERFPIDAREWLGPRTALQPIPKLSEVLSALPDDCLIFIEDKDGDNTTALLDLVTAQPRATDRFVWKQYAPAAQVKAAKERGLLTWGYLTSQVVDKVSSFAERFDALGVQVEESDGVIAGVVATGRPVIAWEVHRRSERDRVRGLGVAGLMCSNVPYVLGSAAAATADRFSTGLRASGDLPKVTNRSWTQQPTIDSASSTLTIDRATSGQTYLMGSLCPLPADRYTLTVTVEWVNAPPVTEITPSPTADGDTSSREDAGIAFAAESDQAYGPRSANEYGAYRVRIAPDGTLELAEHPAGWPEARVIGRLSTPKPEAGERITLEVAVTPQQLSLSRKGAGGSIVASDMNHRGQYLHLWNEARPIRFSAVSVG